MLPVDCSREVGNPLLDAFRCVFEDVIRFQVELGIVVSAFLGVAEVIYPADVLLQPGEGALGHLLRGGGLDAVVETKAE